MKIFKRIGEVMGKQRTVDINLEKTLASVKANYKIVPSMEIKAWKAYLAVAFFSGFMATIIWSAYMAIYPPSQASESQVTLYSSSSVASHKSGESFPLQILLDTAGRNIVAVQAIINYNKNNLELLSLDTSSSDFNYEVKKTIDPVAGQGFLALGKPTPGVNGPETKVATATFRALADVNEPVVSFKFDTTAAVSDSAAILDDGQGTNILQKLAYLYPVNPKPNPSDFKIISIIALADTVVKLDWSTGPLENKNYIIERKTGKAAYAKVGEVSSDIRTYSDTALKAKTAYLWRICQQSDGGDKVCTAETALRTLKKNTILKPRLSLSNENGKVRLNWSPAFALPLDVNVQRKEGTWKKFSNLKTVDSSSNTYLDESAVPGKKYTYRLMISLKGKKTKYSDNKKITTPSEIQTAPQTVPSVAPQSILESPPATVPENSAEPFLQNGAETPAQ